MTNEAHKAESKRKDVTWLRHPTLVLAAFSVLLLITAAATAEVLVLTDGQVIETKGPWQVDGRRITYTALNGTFSALRLSMVNLEESRTRTEALLNPVAPKNDPKPAPEVGLVVRQSDIRTVTAKGPAEPEKPTEATAADVISITSWSEELATVGTRIVGTVQNGSDSVYISLRLEVTLVAENGDELETRNAKLERAWADPGTSLTFEADFPDVFAFSTANFSVKGKPFQSRPPEANGDDLTSNTEEAKDASKPAAPEPPR